MLSLEGAKAQQPGSFGQCCHHFNCRARPDLCAQEGFALELTAYRPSESV